MSFLRKEKTHIFANEKKKKQLKTLSLSVTNGNSWEWRGGMQLQAKEKKLLRYQGTGFIREAKNSN